MDSVLLTWALGALPTYFARYHMFSWNIPARENYAARPSWRIVTYLAKCIPIDRTGSPEHIDSVLAKLKFLLKQGEICTIFPEGTRSRTGRIEPLQAGYGIGKIVRDVPGCRVLCVYLRGKLQKGFSDFPARGDTLAIRMRLVTPRSLGNGLRAAKLHTMRIMETLKAMEDRHFQS